MKAPIKRPRHKRSPDERLNALSHAYGICAELVGPDLREGEAPRTLARYRAFMKSLDGAIRHAQSARTREEANAN